MHDRGCFKNSQPDTDFRQRVGRLSKQMDTKGERILFDYRHKQATLRNTNPMNQMTGYPFDDSAHKSTHIKGIRPRASAWSSAETDRRIHQMFLDDFNHNR